MIACMSYQKYKALVHVNNVRSYSPTDIDGTTLKLLKFILQRGNTAAEIVNAPQNRSSNQRRTNKILIQTMIDSQMEMLNTSHPYGNMTKLMIQ